MPTGHDECIEDTGQCDDGSFTIGSSFCNCISEGREALCPCA